MTDSDTTNPSNPEQEGKKPSKPEGAIPAPIPIPQQPGGTPPPSEKADKLKLKRILTPLYARPKVPQHPAIGKKKLKKIEIPKAVSIEPEPELTEDERKTIAGLKQEPVEGISPIDTPPPPSKAVPEPPQESTEASPEGESPPGEAEEEAKVETLVSAPPKSRLNKILLMTLIPIVLLVGILAAVYFIFDPLGHKLAPLTAYADLPTQESSQPEESVPGGKITDFISLSMSLETADLQEYLDQLKTREIAPSSNPEGVFIDNIFYSPGDPLNPELGLVFKEVEQIESGKQLVIIDSEESPHYIILQ